MKKKFLFPIMLLVASTSLCGCSFFSLLGSDDPTSIKIVSIDGDGGTTKQKLNYNISDLVNNSFFSVSITPTTGRPKLLVLPILFTDSSDFIDSSELADYHEMIRKSIFGTKEETGWHSVSSYYEEESLGKCILEGTVAPWYQSSYSYNMVNNSDVTSSLIKSAVSNWKALNPNQAKSYDSDEDGYIDGVIAIYGGPSYKNIDTKKDRKHMQNSNMWAYTSWTDSKKDTTDPNVKNFIWASYDFMLNDTRYANIDSHTYIHETGHLFGLDDLYDYNNSNSRYAGAFSMQDFNVGGHDPYSMLLYGWSDPYVPTQSCTIEINPFTTTKDLVLLTPEYTASPFDEYILLELYTPNGVNDLDSHHSYNSSYPSGLTNAGIRLWHVDSRLIDVTNATHREYEDNGSGYRLFSNYTITTNIVNSHRYLIGPTNTEFSSYGEYNTYSSTASELRPYHVLELVRRNDTLGVKRGTMVENSHLFRTGDTFNIDTYNNYFVKKGTGIFNASYTFNNGKSFPWTIMFNYVGSDKATITLIKDDE